MRINHQKWDDFQETLEDTLYFNMSGCENLKGRVSLPEEWFYQIMNWAGACTDSGEGEDFYKNPRAMYVALDLIYQLLDCIELHSSKPNAKEES